MDDKAGMENKYKDEIPLWAAKTKQLRLPSRRLGRLPWEPRPFRDERLELP
jgi:hypothetical protein